MSYETWLVLIRFCTYVPALPLEPPDWVCVGGCMYEASVVICVKESVVRSSLLPHLNIAVV